jgi:hypothetical protein
MMFEPLTGLVFFSASIRTENAIGQSCRKCFVSLFHLGEIAEQFTYMNILRLVSGFCVETLGFKLHRLRFFADEIEGQIFRKPNRPAA